MTADLQQLLECLAARGVEVWRGADGRCFVEPLAKLTKGELATLREHRDELAELLAGDVAELEENSAGSGIVSPEPAEVDGEGAPNDATSTVLPKVLAYGVEITPAHVAEQLECAGEAELLSRFDAGMLTDAELETLYRKTQCWLRQRMELRTLERW